ncbi:MAG: helix-turn-helix domain-containing protein [Janthinobacterium lividum]
MQLSRQNRPPGTTASDTAGAHGAGARDAAAVEMPQVGDVVRQLRTDRGLTLQRLAELAGISIGMLGLIERNRANPSLRVIAQIRTALGVSIAELFSDPPNRRPDPDFVRRADSRPWLEFGEISKELLTPGSAPGLHFMILHVPSGGSSGSRPMVHGAQKGGLVLEGSLVLRVDDEEALLVQGDSFLCEAMHPHSIRNPGASSSRVLWIMGPLPAGAVL